jgi:hypothetical protein
LLLWIAALTGVRVDLERFDRRKNSQDSEIEREREKTRPMTARNIMLFFFGQILKWINFTLGHRVDLRHAVVFSAWSVDYFCELHF